MLFISEGFFCPCVSGHRSPFSCHGCVAVPEGPGPWAGVPGFPKSLLAAAEQESSGRGREMSHGKSFARADAMHQFFLLPHRTFPGFLGV